MIGETFSSDFSENSFMVYWFLDCTNEGLSLVQISDGKVYNSPTPRLPRFHYLIKMKLKLGKLLSVNENYLILLVVGLLRYLLK